MKWFRFYAESLDDPKVQNLSTGLFKTWVNILCITCLMDGIIPPLRPLSFKLRMRLDHTLKAINELIEAGLIEENNGVYSVHSWDKRQYKSDLSTHRVKRFRNVSETPPDTDTDIDIEKEIYKEKESTKKVRNKFYAKPTSEEISERVRDELGLPVRSDRSGDTML